MIAEVLMAVISLDQWFRTFHFFLLVQSLGHKLKKTPYVTETTIVPDKFYLFSSVQNPFY